MLVEAVCAEEMLAESGISLFDGDTKINSANEEFLLGKERNDSDWGNLW